MKALHVRRVEIPKPDGVTPNEIPNYINQVESRENWVEQKLCQKFINIFINSLFRAINNKISLYLKLLSNLRYRLYFMGI